MFEPVARIVVIILAIRIYEKFFVNRTILITF